MICRLAAARELVCRVFVVVEIFQEGVLVPTPQPLDSTGKGEGGGVSLEGGVDYTFLKKLSSLLGCSCGPNF